MKRTINLRKFRKVGEIEKLGNYNLLDIKWKAMTLGNLPGRNKFRDTYIRIESYYLILFFK